MKNKLAPPFNVGSLDIYFGKGIDHEKEIIDFALKEKIISLKGHVYFIKIKKLQIRKKKFTASLHQENEELFLKIKNDLEGKWK